MKKAISIAHAEKDKLFYFVITIVVYRGLDQRCLILKRDKGDTMYPNKWALPGGRLSWGDIDINNPDRIDDGVRNFNRPLEKHVSEILKEKAGIIVDNRPRYLDSVFFIRPDNTPSILVRFATHYQSGTVTPKGGFVDFKWVNDSQIKKYNHIKGIEHDILKTIKLFS